MMNDFITTKPTLTPLVAGATTTTITGTLAGQFQLPGNWVAIVASLVLALFITIQIGTPLWQRFLFYLINAITILTVSMGLNSAGIASTKSIQQTQYESRWIPPETDSQEKPFFHNWF